MDFQFTPEQTALRKRVEEFCQAHCSAAQEAARDREPSYPAAMHRAMADSGTVEIQRKLIAKTLGL